MDRNEIEKIEKYNENTKIDPKTRKRYGMYLNECSALYDMCESDIWRGVTLAYQFGMSRGYRAALAEAKR